MDNKKIIDTEQELDEYNELANDLKNAKYGSYIILPLKFNSKKRRSLSHSYFIPKSIHSENINENIRWIFNSSSSICKCYYMDAATFSEKILQVPNTSIFKVLSSIDAGTKYNFRFESIYYIEFKTEVSFLCIGIIYNNINVLRSICNLGYVENHSAFFYSIDNNEKHLNLEDSLNSLFERIAVQKFFIAENRKTTDSVFADAFVYSMTFINKKVKNIQTLKQISFNLHCMVDLFPAYSDGSENDIRYVYAVKDPDNNNSYRWACCISSQTISYVVTDPNQYHNDIHGFFEIKFEHDLPIIIIALYEKYTCLRFIQKITECYDKSKRNRKTLNSLKNKMLEFQVFGIVLPANLCKWNNIREIYGNLMDVNGITDAINEINNKVQLLLSNQENRTNKKIDTIAFIIAVMGVVSIFDSTFSILNIFETTEHVCPYIFTTSILSIVLIISTIAVLMRNRK